MSTQTSVKAANPKSWAGKSTVYILRGAVEDFGRQWENTKKIKQTCEETPNAQYSGIRVETQTWRRNTFRNSSW